MLSQIASSKTRDCPFAAHQDDEHIEILLTKGVKSTIGALLFLGGAGELVASLLTGTGMFDGGHEGKVPLIGSPPISLRSVLRL